MFQGFEKSWKNFEWENVTQYSHKQILILNLPHNTGVFENFSEYYWIITSFLEYEIHQHHDKNSLNVILKFNLLCARIYSEGDVTFNYEKEIFNIINTSCRKIAVR